MTEDAKQTESKPLKIAILGTAPTSSADAPFTDESWEIWGCSCGPMNTPRVTRWFEIHDLKRKKRQCPEYYQWMCETDKPVYLHIEDPNIKAGVVGWERAIIERWQDDFSHGYVYNTNSISWMLCQAILEIEANPAGGEVAIYGVDMAVGSLAVGGNASEYAHQRPSCEYWIGLCRGAGIKCYIPEKSDMLKSRGMYGFDTDNSLLYHRMVVRGDDLQGRKRGAEQQVKEAEANMMLARGGMETIRQIMQQCEGNPTAELLARAAQDLQNQHDAAQHQHGEAMKVRHVVEGALISHDHVLQGCPPGESLV